VATSGWASVQRASVTPSTGLVGGETVSVSRTHFARLHRSTVSVSECAADWQTAGYQATCDSSGTDQSYLRTPKNGSLLFQVIQGDLTNSDGQVVATCGTSRADNTCVVVVFAPLPTGSSGFYSAAAKIKFALP
jgi:hypothetical protein